MEIHIQLDQVKREQKTNRITIPHEKHAANMINKSPSRTKPKAYKQTENQTKHHKQTRTHMNHYTNIHIITTQAHMVRI